MAFFSSLGRTLRARCKTPLAQRDCPRVKVSSHETVANDGRELMKVQSSRNRLQFRPCRSSREYCAVNARGKFLKDIVSFLTGISLIIIIKGRESKRILHENVSDSTIMREYFGRSVSTESIDVSDDENDLKPDEDSFLRELSSPHARI